MMRLALLSCAILAATAVTASGAVRSCGTLSAGPGSLRHGATSGPACMLQAFHTCHAATFILSSFGVDTIATERFRVARAQGRCRVDVAATFAVVPQHPHATGAGFCLSVVRHAGDVVAEGCSGKGLSRTISLTGRH